MQRSRRAAVVYASLTGLLAAVAITAGATAAAANTAGFCSASGAQASCTETHAITGPASVSLSLTVTQGSNQSASVAWTADCSLAGQTGQTSSSSTGMTPLTVNLTLPFANPDSCTVSATGTLTGTASMLLTMTYTTGSSPSPSPSPSAGPPPAGHVVKGYAGKCLDDARNSSAKGAKAEIWTCNAADKAQLWTYSNGELVHNGMCLNDQAWGGNGTKVILWTCNHALNELWTHLSNGEYVLNAKGYRLCLDDPAYSTRNGTQLIVYTCKDSANQRWQQP
jgi:hypothetical protein